MGQWGYPVRLYIHSARGQKSTVGNHFIKIRGSMYPHLRYSKWLVVEIPPVFGLWRAISVLGYPRTKNFRVALYGSPMASQRVSGSGWGE
jgi:hypothetical protein